MNTKADKLEHEHSSRAAFANDKYEKINEVEPRETFTLFIVYYESIKRELKIRPI
jgi:hypothetical protein